MACSYLLSSGALRGQCTSGANSSVVTSTACLPAIAVYPILCVRAIAQVMQMRSLSTQRFPWQELGKDGLHTQRPWDGGGADRGTRGIVSPPEVLARFNELWALADPMQSRRVLIGAPSKAAGQ